MISGPVLSDDIRTSFVGVISGPVFFVGVLSVHFLKPTRGLIALAVSSFGGRSPIAASA